MNTTTYIGNSVVCSNIQTHTVVCSQITSINPNTPILINANVIVTGNAQANTVAYGLSSLNGTIIVSQSNAPVVGQVLVALSSNIAKWETQLSTLNGSSSYAQTFATSTSGSNFTISTAGSVHTFSLPDAGSTSRGVVNTTSQTFSGVKTFSSPPVISSITNTGTLTLPTSTDTLVGRATTDTLTNKTLTLPVISTIVNTGTLTLPTTTDTLVGRATTDTLTNKTLTLPTIASINNGGTLTLPTGPGNLVSRNSTDTLTNKTLTSPVIATIVNTGTLTLPTATDTLVGRSTTDILTNKTLTLPTIASINNGGTLTLPTGPGVLVSRTSTDTLTNKTLTSPVISTIVNTGTLTLPTSTDTLVGRDTTDTLTNKTLTSPVISTIVNTGTLTLPTSTDTLVGRDTTDTLTNKTMNDNTSNVVAQALWGNSGVSSVSTFNSPDAYPNSVLMATSPSTAIWQNPFTCGNGWWKAVGNGTTISLFGFNNSVTGTATARNVATTRLFTSVRRIGYVSSATAGSSAGTRHGLAQFWAGNASGLGGFMYICRFGMSSAATVATQRTFVGLLNATAVIGNVDPSTLLNCVGFACDSADSSFAFFSNDGSGACTKTALSGTFPARDLSVSWYEARIWCYSNTTTFNYYLEVLNGGSIATGSVSTNVPSNTTFLSPQIWTNNGTTALAAGIDIAFQYIYSNF